MIYYFQNAIIVSLIFLSILSLTIVIERFIFLHNFRPQKKRLYNIKENLINKDLKKVEELCRLWFRAPLFLMIAKIIESKQSLIMMEKKIQRDIQEHYDNMEKRLSALSTIASVSPLLGLLGTVLGMIDAFFSITTSSEVTANLANGISNALITTALGLGVAIPSIIFYNLFLGKINSVVSYLERETQEILDYLGELK